MIELLLKKVIYSFGFITIRLRKFKITGIDLTHDLKQLECDKEPVIFDVGANKGQSIKLFRKIWSTSIIHSFEPTSSLASILTRDFKNDRTFINATAMGAQPNKATLFLNQKSGLNSLLLLDTSHENRFRGKKIIAEEEVVVDTVDLYIERSKINKIHLLKTDTQGFDLEVLKGALNSIKSGKIQNILIEINFANMYQNQAKSTTIFEFLLENNFKIIGLYEISRSKSKQSNIEWCTALFTYKTN